MSVVDLHPEELIDKLADGTLTVAERERLDAHVSTCAACRFDLDVRHDFSIVAMELPPAVLVPAGRGLAAGSAQPSVGRDSRESSPGVVPVAPRRRLRGPLLMLSLAAALVAGGSLAAFIVHRVAAPSPASDEAVSVEAHATHGPTRGQAAGDVPKVAGSGVVPGEAVPLRPEAPVVSGGASAGGAATPVAARSSAGSLSANDAKSGKHALPTAAALFSSANQARRGGDTARAIALYRALEAEYPSSQEARVSHVTLARLLLDRGDARSALDGFDEYLAEGGAALGEEALLGRALALQKLGSRDAEAAAWREILRRFPRSVHARLARSRLSDLGAP